MVLPISIELKTTYSGMKGIQFCSDKDSRLVKRGDNSSIAKLR